MFGTYEPQYRGATEWLRTIGPTRWSALLSLFPIGNDLRARNVVTDRYVGENA